MRNQPEHKNSFLRHGENILWESRPTAVPLLEAPYTFRVLLRWIISILLVVFGYWCLVRPEALWQMSRHTHLLIGCASLCIAVYLFFSPFVNIHRLKNNTYYYITDQRFIACCNGRNDLICTYRELTDMTEMTIETIGKGRYNIHIGAMDSGRSIHARDKIQNYDAHQKMMPLTFHSVVDAYNCTDFLPDYICINRHTQPHPVITR